MAVRWHARLHGAERARFESSLLERLVAALGIAWLWLGRVGFTKRRLVVLAWALVPRSLKLVAAGLAAAWLIVAVVTAAVVVFALT
jgi:hypothetical protein